MKIRWVMAVVSFALLALAWFGVRLMWADALDASDWPPAPERTSVDPAASEPGAADPAASEAAPADAEVRSTNPDQRAFDHDLPDEPPRDSQPLVGPNGQPIVGAPPDRQSDLPARSESLPPLDDAEAWKRAREDMATVWRDQTLEKAARFADDNGLTEAERAGMVSVLAQMHDDMSALRRDIEAGRTSPAEGRAGFGVISSRTIEAMGEVLGAEQTSALREALSTLQGGGF